MALKRFICVTTKSGISRSVQVDKIGFIVDKHEGYRKISVIHLENRVEPLEVLESVEEIVQKANATLPTVIFGGETQQ